MADSQLELFTDGKQVSNDYELKKKLKFVFISHVVRQIIADFIRELLQVGW